MTLTLRVFAAFALMAVAACDTGEGSSGASGTFATNTNPDRSDFVALCNETSNFGEAVCDCLADKAMTDYSGDTRLLIYASIAQDTALVQETVLGMDEADVAAAGAFMLTGPQACALENAG